MNLQIIKISDPLWLQTLQKLRHDIYHLPEYVYLESQRTKTIPEAILIVENEKIFFLPYLLRRCDDISQQDLVRENVVDILSPYGYPGLLLNEAAASTPEFLQSAINQLISQLRTKNVCSAFLRMHPIFNQGLNEILSPNICKVTGTTVSVDLRLSEAEIWHQTKSEHRNKINRCKRHGLTAKIVDFKDYLDDFSDIYQETMDRVGADKSYYFSDFYFLYMSTQLADKIHLAIVELNDQIACAGLFTECSGVVQYHLGGTKTKFLKEGPSKLMFDYVRLWAKERGNECLHLGGGVGGSKDSLYRFKAGFSKQSNTFLTLHLITDEEKYLALTNLRAKSLNTKLETLLQSNFFPAYRFQGKDI